MPGSHFSLPLVRRAPRAIVVPSLLVLYFLKLRRREMAVLSTLLWKKAIQDLQVNAPFQKCAGICCCCCNCCCCCCFCLALSRPVTNYTPGAGKTSVILIDRSASMGARIRISRAKPDSMKRSGERRSSSIRMRSAIAGDGHRVRRIGRDGSAVSRPMSPRSSGAIDSIQQTDRKSKLKLAYQLAEAQTKFNPEQLRPSANRPEVWLYSDGRVSDAADLRFAAISSTTRSARTTRAISPSSR